MASTHENIREIVALIAEHYDPRNNNYWAAKTCFFKPTKSRNQTINLARQLKGLTPESLERISYQFRKAREALTSIQSINEILEDAKTKKELHKDLCHALIKKIDIRYDIPESTVREFINTAVNNHLIKEDSISNVQSKSPFPGRESLEKLRTLLEENKHFRTYDKTVQKTKVRIVNYLQDIIRLSEKEYENGRNYDTEIKQELQEVYNQTICSPPQIYLDNLVSKGMNKTQTFLGNTQILLSNGRIKARSVLEKIARRKISYTEIEGEVEPSVRNESNVRAAELYLKLGHISEFADTAKMLIESGEVDYSWIQEQFDNNVETKKYKEEFSNCFYQTGLQHIENGDYKQARKSFVNAKIVNQKNAQSVFLLGYTLEKINPEDIKADYYMDKATNIDPNILTKLPHFIETST